MCVCVFVLYYYYLLLTAEKEVVMLWPDIVANDITLFTLFTFLPLPLFYIAFTFYLPAAGTVFTILHLHFYIFAVHLFAAIFCLLPVHLYRRVHRPHTDGTFYLYIFVVLAVAWWTDERRTDSFWHFWYTS